MLRAIHEIWKIEVGRVIADDDIRVDLIHEVPPSLKHLALIVKRLYLRPDDVRARVECENVSHKRLRLAYRSISNY